MKVLLCGEGGHDIGQAKIWNAQACEYKSTDGWLQVFVRALKGDRLDFSIRRRVELQISQSEHRRLRPLPQGHGTKAMLAKLAAVAGGYDILIFMVDADSPKVGDWRSKVKEIERGFKHVDGDLACIPCVPMSASECWLISDSNAWRLVSGHDREPLPAKPEQIWGARNDPLGNHPHRLFRRLCNNADLPDNRETRVKLAEATDLTVTRNVCPQSLEPFLSYLQAV